MSFSCLELFSGIGGFAVAAEQLGWHVLRAIDIDQRAGNIYRTNFAHAHQVRTIESIPIAELAAIDADLWWMSPPCQPFTRRGTQRGLADPRCEAFRHVVEAIRLVTPNAIAMENVPGFGVSSAADYLRSTLDHAGYAYREWERCPTDLGIPNRRQRFYLVASRDHTPTRQAMKTKTRHLSQYLDSQPDSSLHVPSSQTDLFESAIDRVDPNDRTSVAACFTSAYGKSPVQSGSYIQAGNGLRRFSPREVLRLLGFPEQFQLPDSLSLRQQWKLVGNSLSIPIVRECLASLAATPTKT